MTLYEMSKIIKAASYIVKKDNFLIVGSQAVLGNYLNEVGGFEFARSREIDIVIKESEQEIADLLQGIFGEASYFERTHGIYIDVVDLKTCILPEGWERRLLKRQLEDGPLMRFLSAEDLAFAKYAAWRDKDKAFIAKMWTENLLDIEKMRELWSKLPKDRLSNEELSLIKNRFERQYNELQNLGTSDDS
ncbi:MAG: hypothetical protein J5846_08870 [Desulfovibrio sp.]|nr:hypothetical protein [Desulfovibrio sp.]